MTDSILSYIDFRLLYFEFKTQGDAIKREKYFKSSAGKRFLKKELSLYFNAHPADASQLVGHWIEVSKTLHTGSLPDCVIQVGIPVGATKTYLVYHSYVLKSVNHDYFYKGYCKDLVKRIQQHNSGMTESIRPYIPFTLFYKEEFQT